MKRTESERSKSVNARTADIAGPEELERADGSLKTPCCFLCNGVAVKIVYSEDGESLEDILAGLLGRMA